MLRGPAPLRPMLVLLLPFLLATACIIGPQVEGQWPPSDFGLDVQLTTFDQGQLQVRQRALFFADGLVVYREADDSIPSGHPEYTDLPVYRRMCAYKMHWRSIRHLARALHAASVHKVRQPATPPEEGDGETRWLTFHLTYMGNDIDVVAHGQVYGLLNKVLHIVNSFLPEGHGFVLPEMAGEPIESHLQDVPAVRDSVTGALGYHQELLERFPEDIGFLRDTFALACVARDWPVAESCVEQIGRLRPSLGGLLRDVLTKARAA